MALDELFRVEYPFEGITYRVGKLAKLEPMKDTSGELTYSIEAEITQQKMGSSNIILSYKKAKGIVKQSKIVSGPPAYVSADVWERHKEYLNAMLLSYFNSNQFKIK